MQLPHLRTNYGSVSGFFSLVDGGDAGLRALGNGLQKMTKAHRFAR